MGRSSNARRSRVLAVLATLALSITGFAVPAKAAQVRSGPTTFGPISTQANSCWGTHSIYGDGWGGIVGSAGTVCDGTAQYLRAIGYIRVRDRFGYVSTCGYNYRDGAYTSSVVASSKCLSAGSGYTYFLYSEHYAQINGQVFSFTGGQWE
ncbi:hypothetical protein ABGB16_06470 [Micromonospora sp. B11E3]|uniref:hypothetical protein n=1 Tax=Micromonospora sp. B11E3 TaxID=3153562 RepID=UPI00325E69F3